MEGDGWVTVETVGQTGRPDKKVYAVSAAGRQVLADWLAEPMGVETFRSELAVKLRGASYGDRATLLRPRRGRARRPRDPAGALPPAGGTPCRADPTGLQLDQLLVLRGGIGLEEFWIAWLTDYLDAHQSAPAASTTTDDPDREGTSDDVLPAPPRADHPRRPDPAQPRGHGLDAHRPRGLPVGHRQAGGLLRRARPRRRRADRDRRLRAQQARLAQALRLRDDHPAAGDPAPAGHRRGARGGRRDRDADPARGPLRLPPVLRRRLVDQVADHALQPARAVDQGRRPDGRPTSPTPRAWRRRRATTASRSWGPRAT